MAFPLSRFPRNPEKPLPVALDLWYTALVASVNYALSTLLTGEGDPEGVVTAPQGKLFLRTDGGASTTLYVKTSGGVDPATLTDTGWVGK